MELEDPLICARKGWRPPTQRARILSLFGAAQSTHLSCAENLNQLIDRRPDLNGFVLERGVLPKIGLHQPHLWEWMAKIRESNGCRSTFHFPNSKAGPDICFCLTNRQSNERILCVIQVTSFSIYNCWEMVNQLCHVHI